MCVRMLCLVRVVYEGRDSVWLQNMQTIHSILNFRVSVCAFFRGRITAKARSLKG